MTRWLRISAGLTLLALALMVWSLVTPTPLPVMLAMSVGQVIGTAAFAMYGWVVLVDLRRIRRLARIAAAEEEARAAAAAAPSAAVASSAVSAVDAASEPGPPEAT
ncbi:MAG: hypothetical protein R3B06_06050 [Kofleriaceae bacterium]